MTALWSLAEMQEAMDARPVGKMPDDVTGISIDTRTVKPGEAFFAIKGEKLDGHDFVNQAMKAGASVAVIAESRLVSFGAVRIPLLVVPDVLVALEKLGMAARARTRAQIIAVTGSAGKTSVKEMLRTALSASPLGGGAHKVHASAASFNNHFNNHWGVPLTLARMPADTRFGVFEIGMNHAGEITPLVEMVRPQVVVITTIAPAHLGSFESVDDIARAKAEIFTGLVPGGAALINRDIKQYTLLKKMAAEAGVGRLLTFGAKKGADFRLVSLEAGPDGSTIEASIEGEKVSYRLAVPGEHQAINSLAVLGAASLAGADVQRCAAALANAAPEKGRGQTHELDLPAGRVTVIDESYNANPASMEAALKVLGSHRPKGRRIAVLGDMLELGESSARLHKALKKPIEENGIDLVFLAGPEMAALAGELHSGLLGGHFPDAAALSQALLPALRDGDAVMLKASNGIRFAAIVQTLLGATKACT
ncbi:MAG: UDP-N-acetylmuramoylalanyl-D-glutamyl-2,6-diaminopimelate--D-alanyl-D-alanine ligase, partial [Nitratireductor sp.]|nr:UDP-N-acetylmuramoylalanyl-D-glutamyl-2,6-diaminopimelate--D-alanyl-D-alanine ligase [Nitratireductor sp.]